MLECPVCNGLTSLHQFCHVCNSVLDDEGRVEDFLAPYAPYMELQTTVTCIHLLHCETCDTDLRYVVSLEGYK